MPEHTSILPEEPARIDREERPAPVSYEDLAARLTVSLAAPELTEDAVYEGCRAAAARRIGGVRLRPSDVDLAKSWLEGTPVRLIALTGYPGGVSTTAARLYEGRDVVRRGVTELALTMNLGKLVSRKFLYLESELQQMAEQCHLAQARLHAVFEMTHLQQDHVLIGMKLLKRTGVDAMDLTFDAPIGESGPSLERMAGVVRYAAHHAKSKFGIHVSAPALHLEGVLTLTGAGADSVTLGNAVAVADAWRDELQRREQERERLEAERQRPAGESAGGTTEPAPAPQPSDEPDRGVYNT